MMSGHSLGIRTYLMLLVLLALCPALCIILGAGWESRQEALADAESRALYVVRDVANEYDGVIESTRKILDTLVKIHGSHSWSDPNCRDVLDRILKANPDIANFQVVNPEGDVVMSSLPIPSTPYNVREASCFKQVMQSKCFCVGDYAMSRTAARPVIHLGMPLLDANNEVSWVLMAALDLTYCNRIFGLAHLPEGAVLAMTDREGTRLYRSLDNERYMGTPDLPEMFARISGPSEEGVFVAEGIDLVRRLYAYRQLKLEHDALPYSYMRVGIPMAPVLAVVNAMLVRWLLFLALAAVLAFGVAWFLGNYGIVHRVQRLAEAARRVGEGDLSARSGLPHTSNELGILARVYDEMGAALESRENERRRVETALKLTQFAMDNSLQAIVWLTPEGVVKYANEAACRLAGHDAEALTGLSVWEVTKLIQEKEWPEWWRTVCSKQMLTKECVIEGANGGSMTLELAANRVTFDTQDLCICHVRDISAQRRAEAQLRQIQKMDAIGALAAGIAHDFNNLLTGILGHANLLTMEPALSGFVRDAALAIEQAATRAAELTRQLLGFARQGKFLNTRVDINAHVHETVTFLTRTIDKSIAIEERCRADSALTRGDPNQIQQVILNLAVNARDAMPHGGKMILETENVFLDSEYCAVHPGATPGQYVALHVSDTGCGIPKNVQDRIFEPFFTTKEVGKGTGLGLATAYGVVKAHGGSIRVYSEVGQGARFTVYLPLESGGELDENPMPKRPAVVGSTHILLVDDEDLVRQLVTRILRKLGHTVVEMASGEDALTYYQEHHAEVDLAIVDMNMPGMNGRECLVALRRINPELRAMLATGYSRDGEVQEVLDMGRVEFVQKPFRLETLAEALGVVLAESARSKVVIGEDNGVRGVSD